MTTARRDIHAHHFYDPDGNPAGGSSWGEGFAIGWQHGPTRAHGGDEPRRNGAFVEEVLLACRDRLEWYQGTRFTCDANAAAIDHIGEALAALEARTAERQARGVEGTNTV